jgi:hypothetical protein
MRLKPPGKSRGCAKTGGRRKGSVNKATLLRQEALNEAYSRMGITPEQLAEISPLKAMLVCMHRALEQRDYAAVLTAATAAAPYVHPRLASTELKVSGSLSSKSDAELAVEIADLERKAAAVQALH